MRGIIFHKLKGINGWSNCPLNNIDVAKILSIKTYERLFKITDNKYPYTLHIKYEFVINNFFETQSVCDNNLLNIGYVSITKRYETPEDVQSEINDITSSIKKLNNYKNSIKNEINKN